MNETLDFLKEIPKSLLNNKLKILALEEGVRARPYEDTAFKLTIGIGRNLEDNPLSVKEIYYLFDNDIDRVLAELNTLSYFTTLSEVRQLALINMNFNMGFPKFKEFKKLNAALINKDYKLAAGEVRDSLYWRNEYTHARAERIARMIETNQMDKFYEL